MLPLLIASHKKHRVLARRLYHHLAMNHFYFALQIPDTPIVIMVVHFIHRKLLTKVCSDRFATDLLKVCCFTDHKLDHALLLSEN